MMFTYLKKIKFNISQTATVCAICEMALSNSRFSNILDFHSANEHYDLFADLPPLVVFFFNFHTASVENERDAYNKVLRVNVQETPQDGAIF